MFLVSFRVTRKLHKGLHDSKRFVNVLFSIIIDIYIIIFKIILKTNKNN